MSCRRGRTTAESSKFSELDVHRPKLRYIRVPTGEDAQGVGRRVLLDYSLHGGQLLRNVGHPAQPVPSEEHVPLDSVELLFVTASWKQRG